MTALDQWGTVRALGPLRIAIGVAALLHLRPFLDDARAGLAYDEHFWKPFLSWLPHLPGELWFVLLWAGAGAAVLMTIGLFSRVATKVTFAVVASNLLLSETHFHHNRAFLAILLLSLALLPSGRDLSLDAWLQRRRGRPELPDLAPLWPLVLVRAQVSLVYLSSGLGKLIDPDWASGLVLWDRAVRHRDVLDPLPGWVADLLTARSLYAIVAPAALVTELFLAVGLWFRRTRPVAVVLAIAFHVAIEVTSQVEVFSLAAIAALTIWMTPSSPVPLSFPFASPPVARKAVAAA